jgi:hypothetical protein
MSQKYKTKSGESIEEYVRPGVCQVCGHASVRPDGHLYEDVITDDNTTKKILVSVYCHICVPYNLRTTLFYRYGRAGRR